VRIFNLTRMATESGGVARRSLHFPPFLAWLHPVFLNGNGGNTPIGNRFCRFALSSALAVGLTLCGAQAFAQDNAPPDTAAPAAGQGPGGGMGRRGGMDPDRQLARMTKRYNLSADQQSLIKPILMDQQQQMQLLRQDSSLSPDEKKAKMRGIHSDSNSKIEAILNNDQKKKFDGDQQGNQERMQQRMQGGGGNAAPPPPPQQ